MLHPIYSTPLMAALGLSAVLGGVSADTVECSAVKEIYRAADCCDPSTSTFESPTCGTLENLRTDVNILRKAKKGASRCDHALNFPFRHTRQYSKTIDRLFKYDSTGIFKSLAVASFEAIEARSGGYVGNSFSEADLNRRVHTVCPNIWNGNALEGKNLLEIGANIGYHMFIFPVLAGRGGHTRMVNDVFTDNYIVLADSTQIEGNNSASLFDRFVPIINSLVYDNAMDFSPVSYGKDFDTYTNANAEAVFGLDESGAIRTYDLINVNNIFSRILFNSHTAAELREAFRMLYDNLNPGGRLVISDWWNPMAENTNRSTTAAVGFERFNKGTVAMRPQDDGVERCSVFRWDGTEVFEKAGNTMNLPHPDDPLYTPSTVGRGDEPIKSPEDIFATLPANVQALDFVSHVVPNEEYNKVTTHIPSLGKSTPACIYSYFDETLKAHAQLFESEAPLASGAEYLYDDTVFMGPAEYYRSMFSWIIEKPAA